VTMPYKRFVISVFAISLMLLGMTLLPVSAAFVPTQLETTEQSMTADENGHTYVYAPAVEDFSGISFPKLVHDEDVDVDEYDYLSTNWDDSSYSWTGPASRTTTMPGTISPGYGWLDKMADLYPTFYDYANTTSDPLSISYEFERTAFPLPIGEEISIIMDPGQFHFATFNLTTEEFMYLTIGSRSDLLEAYILVMDSNGIILNEGGVVGGNIEILPFLSSGPGMYILLIQVMAYDDNLNILDLFLEETTPVDLPVGGYAEGVLTGSEYFADPTDGSLIHQEKAPGAITYRFSTDSTTPGVITHSMNLPEIDTDIYNWYVPWIQITSSVDMDFIFDARFLRGLASNDDPFYYQSFQNETYYLTVVGMENVEYMLSNEYAMIDELPVNEKFYLENNVAEDDTKAFTLSLSQDSVLRVNSTEGTYGYSFSIFSVFDDGNYRELYPGDSSSFDNAEFYYIPAGEYLVRATCGNADAWGFYDFNLGPVIDGLGSVSVDVGSVVGLRFDTNALDWYNVSVTFDTHANVTAGTDITFINTYGGTGYSLDMSLGNRQSGLGWVKYNQNYTDWVTNKFSDGFGIIAVSPYDAYNNTDGLPGPEYHTYSCDYTVSIEDGLPWKFNDTASTSLSTGWYNFTLGDPADVTENYLLTLNGEMGQWLNVSVSVEDVDDWSCTVYQIRDGNPQILHWSSLSDTFVGDYTGEASFQFGCINETVMLHFWVLRTMAGEGRLDIAFDDFTMNTMEYMPPLMYQGEVVVSGIDLGLVAVGVGGAAVIIVVIVIIVKKKGGS